MELKNKNCYNTLPKHELVEIFINEMRKLLFPGYFEKVEEDCQRYTEKIKENIYQTFSELLNHDFKKVDIFFQNILQIEQSLKTDLKMTFDSDPACESVDEIILTYPGMYAITIYRIAHQLYELEIPMIPRMMSEYAHSKTGIDIHPGAVIDDYFFIDHGTGIVIGETTKIGHHVKIYQGVTLGAISLGAGNKLKGIKRHPTIGNNVTIYSGASILGGETIIGNDVTIGSNVFLMESIPDHTRVVMKKPELEVKEKTNKFNKF